MTLKEVLGDAYKEEMTTDEIETALADITIDDKSSELDRLKKALDKSTSEAADYKKQLRTRLTEEEQKAQKEAEERAELQAAYEKLLSETQISKNKAKLLSLGYDEKLAEETAEAIVKGDTDKVFENQLKHQQSYEKKIKAEILKSTPQPVGGNGGMYKEMFDKLSLTEKAKMKLENPALYGELSKLKEE